MENVSYVMPYASTSTAVLSPISAGDPPLEYSSDSTWTEEQRAWARNITNYADSQLLHPTLTCCENTSNAMALSSQKRLKELTFGSDSGQGMDSLSSASDARIGAPQNVPRRSPQRPSLRAKQSPITQDEWPLKSQQTSQSSQLRAPWFVSRDKMDSVRGESISPGDNKNISTTVRDRSLPDHKTPDATRASESTTGMDSRQDIAFALHESRNEKESEIVDDLIEIQWYLSNIPPELKQMSTGIPATVITIIEEFWQNCQAIQASAHSVQEQAIERGKRNNQQQKCQAPSGESLTFVSPNTKPILDGSVPNTTETRPGKGEQRTLIDSFTTKLWKWKQPIKQASSDTVALKECVSCFDEVSTASSVDVPCQHSYCSKCFAQLVMTAMQCESSWPPKCCLTEIPRSIILLNLSNKQVLEYGAKEKEYKTPANGRWYCTNPKCLKFFEAIKHGDWTACTHCKYKMCLHCRGERHQGSNQRCSQDRNLQATLAEAQLEGWRTCHRCGTMVERKSGCRHITCTCGAEFCYHCGVKWHNCSCSDQDMEQRLRQLADARADAIKRREADREEEAATQAAIEAVAEQQRKEEEQQLLKEKMIFEKMESERQKGIKAYYEDLRAHLQSIHEIQAKAVAERHNTTIAASECELADLNGRRYKFEKTTISKKGEAVKSILQEFEEQLVLDLLLHHPPISEQVRRSNKTIDAVNPLEILQTLDMQAPTRQDRKADIVQRIENVLNIKETNHGGDTDYRKELQELDVTISATTKQIEGMKHSFELENKWVEFAARERLSLLHDDEARFIRSGADAPPLQLGPSAAHGDVGVEKYLNQSELSRALVIPAMPTVPAITFEKPKQSSFFRQRAETSIYGGDRGHWLSWRLRSKSRV